MKQFVQDAIAEPAQYYKNPWDVIRDRRLTKGPDGDQRRPVLEAWMQKELSDDGKLQGQIRAALEELERQTAVHAP